MVQIPKERQYKLVVGNCRNTDQELVGFYPNHDEANKALCELKVKPYEWLKGRTDFLCVNPTDPEKIFCPRDTDYQHYNRALIPDEEWGRVLSSDASAEIWCNCMTCGAGTYYNLSKMIDKDCVVIDIGCAYNPQSYLFQDHAGYIGVDLQTRLEGYHFAYFKAPGSELYNMTGQTFIRDVLPTLDLELNAVFAIVNYMPDDECAELVRKTFKNLWVYYPY